MFNLVSCGNHAQDILAIAQRRHFQGIVIYDDDPSVAEQTPPDLSGPTILAVNDSLLRRSLGQRLVNITPAPPLIDPSAVVGLGCDIGYGSVVGAQAALVCNVSLGIHVHVNYRVGITRTNVGDYSTISPGATICGNVEIGQACTIGANATICERTRIGKEVTVGAGAIVPPYSVIPDGMTVVGVWKNV